MTPPTWHRHALCVGVGVDPDIFFDSKGRGAWREARNICSQCPVRQDCLDEAIRQEIGVGRYRYGFRGGMTPNERAHHERKQNAS